MGTNRIGVIVGQLGTPAGADAKSVRRFLAEFLSDRRVIDYSPFVWQPILRGIILRVRPARSAKLYQRIWREDGSPLMVFTQQQASRLQEILGEEYKVIIGMTYGEPSMRSAISSLEAEGIDRIVVLPMYPQYSSTTTASVYDAAYLAAAGRLSERKRFIPTLRFVPPYYDDPGYIDSMVQHLRRVIETQEQEPDHYIFSYHGNPARYDRTGDPYKAQCEATTQLLVEKLGLQDDQWSLSFQSRFGPEEWLQPYTDETIEEFAKTGKRVLVFPPGFTVDCLETLDELGNEGLEEWEEAGGAPEKYSLAACLNADENFMQALAQIVQREAQGWNN